LCRYRDDLLKPVVAPAGELLSFASPKESNQRKGDPDAASILRSVAFDGDRQKGLPAPLPMSGIHAAPPLRAIPVESYGARRGIREKNRRDSKETVYLRIRMIYRNHLITSLCLRRSYGTFYGSNRFDSLASYGFDNFCHVEEAARLHASVCRKCEIQRP